MGLTDDHTVAWDGTAVWIDCMDLPRDPPSEGDAFRLSDCNSTRKTQIIQYTSGSGPFGSTLSLIDSAKYVWCMKDSGDHNDSLIIGACDGGDSTKWDIIS